MTACKKLQNAQYIEESNMIVFYGPNREHFCIVQEPELNNAWVLFDDLDQSILFASESQQDVIDYVKEHNLVGADQEYHPHKPSTTNRYPHATDWESPESFYFHDWDT